MINFHTCFVTCVKYWQRNAILKQLQPGKIAEQLWMVFNQYTKMYLLCGECVQFTSKQLMIKRLFPLHYSKGAFVSRQHANENNVSSLI